MLASYTKSPVNISLMYGLLICKSNTWATYVFDDTMPFTLQSTDHMCGDETLNRLEASEHTQEMAQKTQLLGRWFIC